MIKKGVFFTTTELSSNLLFYNKMMDKTAMKRFISRLINHFGVVYTAHILDQFKTVGFKQATYESISLSIDDLLTAPSKQWLIQDAEHENYYEEKEFTYGRLDTVEKLRQLVETWYTTSEFLKQEMTPSFRVTDPLNPVHMMCFSGARGSISQVHQLVGMRGLMSNSQGEIVDLPIRNNFREGLSVVEYTISCYGARKGVVDTAIRTADAGYLTRRLVEVVQHIVVRKKDCGTIQGILVNPIKDGEMKNEEEMENEEKIENEEVETFVQLGPGLIGRVLADNVYVDTRCIATRNQDIGAELVNQLIAFQTQPILIRSPLTCKSIFWICQLCFGWNPTYGYLVELGEAVGIIAGQSIGEPGTQLTLRTFHTGGVYTGTIAQYIRTPLTGILKFDVNLIYPTRTKFGYPAWVCDNDLPVTIHNKNEIIDLIIPSQSLILVQNSECVESKQVIAEVSSTLFPIKEKIEKNIYSELDGEMHCGATLINNRPKSTPSYLAKYLVNSINLSVKKSLIWILSGQYYKLSGIQFLLYKDGDNINAQYPLAKKIELLEDQTEFESFDSSLEEDEQTFDHSEFDHNQGIFENKDWDYSTEFVSEVPKDEVLQNNEFLFFSDDSKYITKVSGIIKYGTIRIGPTSKENQNVEDEETEKVIKGYKIIGKGNFFVIPEEVHTVHTNLSSISVKNNDIIRVGARITSNIYSQVNGLVKVQKIAKKLIEIRILPGNIIYLGKKRKLSKLKDVLVPPGKKLFERFKSNRWTYLQWVQPNKEMMRVKSYENKVRQIKQMIQMKHNVKNIMKKGTMRGVTQMKERKKERPFALVRPAIEYAVTSGSILSTKLFHQELLREQKVGTVKYILYEDGEEVRTTGNKNIQLVKTHLILDWEKEEFFQKEVYISLIGIRISNTFKYFLQFILNKSPLDDGSYEDTADLKYLFSNKVHYTNLFTNNENYLFSQHKGTIHSLYENQEDTSLLILSANDLNHDLNHCSSLIGTKYSNIYYDLLEENKEILYLETDVSSKNYDNSTKFLKSSNKSRSNKGKKSKLVKKLTANFALSAQENFQENLIQITLSNKLGLLGSLLSITKISSFSHWITLNGTLSNEYYSIDNSKKTSQLPHWYFLDEKNKMYHFILCKNIIHNLLNRCFLSSFYPCKNPFSLVNLGQLISKGFLLIDEQISQSRQIVAIHTEYLVLRLTKSYLVSEGGIIHTNCGEPIPGGTTLLTLFHEKLKYGDITQDLIKIERLLESRLVTPVSIDFKNSYRDWRKDIIWIFGNSWGFSLSAKISLEQSQINLVNQIQKIYRSHGVQISDKYIEIIVRQMTSKIITLEDGTASVFSPGELIELSRAQRVNSASEKKIYYRPILLGITKASLNTKSFISEASFRETTRVLAGAAIRGRIDWLRGLKENVIIGGMIPAGTGCEEINLQVTFEKRKEEMNLKTLQTKNNKIFINKIKNLFLHEERKFSFFPTEETIGGETLNKETVDDETVDDEFSDDETSDDETSDDEFSDDDDEFSDYDEFSDDDDEFSDDEISDDDEFSDDDFSDDDDEFSDDDDEFSDDETSDDETSDDETTVETICEATGETTGEATEETVDEAIEETFPEVTDKAIHEVLGKSVSYSDTDKEEVYLYEEDEEESNKTI